MHYTLGCVKQATVLTWQSSYYILSRSFKVLNHLHMLIIAFNLHISPL